MNEYAQEQKWANNFGEYSGKGKAELASLARGIVENDHEEFASTMILQLFRGLDVELDLSVEWFEELVKLSLNSSLSSAMTAADSSASVGNTAATDESP
jgi:hypothetical protein